MASSRGLSTEEIVAKMRKYVSELLDECKSNGGHKSGDILIKAGNVFTLFGRKYFPLAAGLVLAGHWVYTITNTVNDFLEFLNLQREYKKLKKWLKCSVTKIHNHLANIDTIVNVIEDLMGAIRPYADRGRHSQEFRTILGQLNFKFNSLAVQINACQLEINYCKRAINNHAELVQRSLSTPLEEMSQNELGMIVSTGILCFKTSPVIGIIGGATSLALALGARAVRWKRDELKEKIIRELHLAKQELEGLQTRLDKYKDGVEIRIKYLRDLQINIEVNEDGVPVSCNLDNEAKQSSASPTAKPINPRNVLIFLCSVVVAYILFLLTK